MSSARLSKARNFECGVLFQTLRTKARLRQQDIASMVGVGVNTVQYWESGTTYPKVDALKKLLEVYVRFEVFNSGRELAEAEELWEKVRQEAPRLNALFDQEWFKGLLTGFARSRQLKIDQSSGVSDVPNNLPQRLTSFIGRKKELTMIVGWLRPISVRPSVRLVTLSGAGGSGKSSLALEVVPELLPDYPQGIWLVELAPLSTASGVIQTLASTLSLKEQPGVGLLSTITDYLREKSVLLVLDNCEHLIEECARVVDSLLRDCPRLVVLATSREVLKVSGETVFRVPSLTLPPANAIQSREKLKPIEELMEYEAVQLFVERGKSASPHFTLNKENEEIVAQLCRRLDGIPLAIELAAARLRVLSVFELNERLADRFRLLKSGSDRTVLPRHQTLRATVDWSYELLSQPERVLFRRLAVFAGGWTLEAAEEICTLAGPEKEDVLDLLHELVNKSLVIAEEEPVASIQPTVQKRRVRFRLLETLREYAQEQLEQIGSRAAETDSEKQALQVRHLVYYSNFARQCTLVNEDGRIYDKGRGVELLALEYSNLREALDWSTGTQKQDIPVQLLFSAIELTLSTAHLWDSRSYFQEGHKYLSRLQIKASQAGLDSTSQYGWICDWLGRFTNSKGDYKQAQFIQEKTLRLFQQLENTQGMMKGLNHLAATLVRLSVNEEAFNLFQQSLSLANELHDRLYITRNLYAVGRTCIELGRHEEAAEYLQASLKVAQEYGNPSEVANCLLNLAMQTLLQGESEAAKSYLQESLPLLRITGNKSKVSSVLVNLGIVASQQRDYNQAIYYFEEALALEKEIGSRVNIANSLNNLAQIAIFEGKYEQADRYNQEVLLLSQERGDRLGVGLSTATDAELERLQGNYKIAITKLQRSLAIFWELENKHYSLNAMLDLARLASNYCDTLKEQNTNDSQVSWYSERAIRLAGVVSNLLATIGEKFLLDGQEKLERVCETSRNRIGESAFERIFAEGQAMPLEEAVVYALAETSELIET